MAQPSGQDCFNILALSGGGYLGLFSAFVLAELEERAGVPLADCFDLVAGTSIGGIIGLALAHRYPMRDLLERFNSQGEAIFSARKAPLGAIPKTLDLLRSALSPKYSSSAFREFLIEIFNEATIGDLKTRVIVPAVNLSRGAPKVFKTPHARSFVWDKRFSLVDVALATSAAPTFFPIAEVGDELFCDGGLFANAPDLMALHEAEHFLAVPRNHISVLSIGTTTSSYSLAHSSGIQFGLAKWFINARLMQTIFASQQQLVNYMMQHIMSDKYFRIDHAQSREQEQELRLDVAVESARKTIRALGSAAVSIALADSRMSAFLSHRAQKAELFL